MGDDYIHFCRITAQANWGPDGGQQARIEQALKDELGVYVYFDDQCVWSAHCEGWCDCEPGRLSDLDRAIQAADPTMEIGEFLASIAS